MKFEFHGFWACFSFFVTTLAIVYPQSYNVFSVPILPVLAMIFTQILANHALTLLDQVPHQTVIVKPNWVVAPHQEAFRRTIAMMGYANLRLLGQVVMQSQLFVDYPFRHYIHYILLGRSWYQFNPLSSNFYNGNTYIFVIPMFVGVTLDLCQFLYFPKHDLVSMSHLLGVANGGHVNGVCLYIGLSRYFEYSICLLGCCVWSCYAVWNWLVAHFCCWGLMNPSHYKSSVVLDGEGHSWNETKVCWPSKADTFIRLFKFGDLWYSCEVLKSLSCSYVQILQSSWTIKWRKQYIYLITTTLGFTLAQDLVST